MRLKRQMLLLALGMALSAPLSAAEPEVRPLEPRLDPQLLLGGIVTEKDVGLLFAHLRASLLAAAENREPPQSEELARRLEVMGAELRLRGIIAGLALSHAAERAARDAVRELNAPRSGD
ncbi:MAG: hypothetical protein ACO3IW_08495 [Burkholderiales bacterium]